jgi:hypothetical protein
MHGPKNLLPSSLLVNSGNLIYNGIACVCELLLLMLLLWQNIRYAPRCSHSISSNAAATAAVYIKNDGWLYLKQMSRHHMCMHCCSSLDYFLSFICQKLFLISSEAAALAGGMEMDIHAAHASLPWCPSGRITQQVRNSDALLKRTRANAFINTAAAAARASNALEKKKVGAICARPPAPAMPREAAGYFF